MKVAIAYPPLQGKGSPMLTQNRQFQWYHVGSYIYPVVPAYAATLLAREGHRVIWEDAIAGRKTAERFWRILERERPDLVAMETKTPVVRQHWAVTDRIKQLLPDCRVALMGDHVTALPGETMKNCSADFAITGGHYDFLLRSIVRHLESAEPLLPGVYFREGDEIRDTGPFGHDHDLDSLPFIDRRLTRADLYGEKWRRYREIYYTMAGRDCPWHRCRFCSWTTTYPRFTRMSVERALDEIGYLIQNHGAREIFDDSGTFPGGEWLQEFCRGMIERGFHRKILISCNMRFDYLQDPEVPRLMKRAGWRKIKSGLESANQQTLDRICKGVTVEQIANGCRNAARAGIDVHLTVMVGFPWETREQVRRTVELARQLMREGSAEMLQSTVVVPYPGTPLYAEAVEKGWLTCAPDDYERFDMRGSVLRTGDISSDEIVRFCNQVYRSFLSPRFVARQLARNITDPGYLLRGARAVVGHLLDFGTGKERP